MVLRSAHALQPGTHSPMHCSKLLWLAFPALAALPAEPEEVRIVFREGLVYEMHQRVSSRSVCTGTMEMQGEEFELDDEFLESLGTEQTDEISMRDEVLELEDGRAIRVAREYTDLEQRSTEDGEELERTGPLVGEPLELTLEEDGTLLVRVTDDALDIEQKYLVNHSLHEFFLPLLPQGAVEPGDTWELDEAAALDFCIRHDPLYFELPAELEPDAPYVDALRAGAECAVEVAFEGLGERDGVECHVLSFVSTIECALDELPEDPTAADEDEMTGETSTDMTSTGRLWIDAARRFPLAMEVSMGGREGGDLEWTEEGQRVQMALETEVEVTVVIEWELVEAGR